MLKIWGAFLVILGTTVYGFLVNLRKKTRVDRLKEITESLVLFKWFIEFDRGQIGNIFGVISKKCNKQYLSDFYSFLNKKLIQRSETDFCLVWEQGVEKYLRDVFLTEEDCLMINRIGKIPLYMDYETAASSVEIICNEIKEIIDKEEKNYEKKKKVYQSLGFAAGVVIVLLLL